MRDKADRRCQLRNRSSWRAVHCSQQASAPADGIFEGVDLHKVGKKRQDVLDAHCPLGALQQQGDRADAFRLQASATGKLQGRRFLSTTSKSESDEEKSRCNEDNRSLTD